MTYPDPHVTDSGVPEVEQADFEEEVARRQARLEADRVANRPATPAEERTGVSDVKWAVHEQVAILRAYLDDVASRFLPSESSVIFETLDRIEQWTRGAQR